MMSVSDAAQAMSDGIMTVAQSGSGTSSGWQTAVITAISAAGSIVSLIAKNTTSSSAKSALLTAGGIVGLLADIVSSASGLITPQVRCIPAVLEIGRPDASMSRCGSDQRSCSDHLSCDKLMLSLHFCDRRSSMTSLRTTRRSRRYSADL